MTRDTLIDAMARAEIAAFSDVDLDKMPEHSRRHWLVETAAALPLAVDAILAPIEALHYAANPDADRTPACDECHGKAGTHPCGCWAEFDRLPVCGGCYGEERYEAVPWPCRTRQACDALRAEYGGAR
jgi:hypothetical protein